MVDSISICWLNLSWMPGAHQSPSHSLSWTGERKRVVVSASQVVSAALLSLGEDSLHSSPAPAWCLSHGRQSSMNFSNLSPSHRLQFFMSCSIVGSSRGIQSFRNRLLQHGYLMVPHGTMWMSQILPQSLQYGLLSSWVRSLLQHKLSRRSQPPLVIHLLWHGVLHKLQVGVPLLTSMGCRGMDSLPHQDLRHRQQGNLCSGTWSTSSPFSFTDLRVCRAISHVFSLPSLAVAALLKYVISDILSPLLLGLDFTLASPCLGASWH